MIAAAIPFCKQIGVTLVGMVSLVARTCLALAIVSTACGRVPLSPADAAAGSVPVGGAPDSGQIGGAGNDAGLAGGDGRADQEHLDGATRANILAPLAATDTMIDQAAGAALFELAKGIGYARGYAMCTCLADPPLPAEGLDSCSRAEAGLYALFQPMQARCIFDLSRELPGFDDYLRCRTKQFRESGRDYAECAMGTDTRTDGSRLLPCGASDSVQELLLGHGCEAAFYCTDGTFTQKGRCDFTLDCSDGADERGCGHFVCGDKLIDPGGACDTRYCPVAPPFCLPNDPSHILCGDGTETHILNLCNGSNDCVNGRDEDSTYCP